MNLTNAKKKLNEVEQKLFVNQTILLDASNIILQYGIEGYHSLLTQINEHQPKRLIGKMDANSRYKVRSKFGKNAFDDLNELIKNGELECTPSKSECDVYLIQANIRDPNSLILSNDGFNDFNPFWVNVLKVVKFTEIDSRFYFNLDLKSALDNNNGLSHRKSEVKQEKSGLEQLWNSAESTEHINIYPEEVTS